MSQHDPDAPVSEDAFPEFSEPPRQRPAPGSEPGPTSQTGEADERQAGVDEVLARLRKSRAEGDH